MLATSVLRNPVCLASLELAASTAAVSESPVCCRLCVTAILLARFGCSPAVQRAREERDLHGQCTTSEQTNGKFLNPSRAQQTSERASESLLALLPVAPDDGHESSAAKRRRRHRRARVTFRRSLVGSFVE